MSETDISYSCGSCAYPLNLKFSDQIASAEGSGHKTSTKKGFVSFQSIDPSRFTQEDEISCFPIYFGRNHPKTKLLCRKCGAHIGQGKHSVEVQHCVIAILHMYSFAERCKSVVTASCDSLVYGQLETMMGN